jgi:hypothetical protein
MNDESLKEVYAMVGKILQARPWMQITGIASALQKTYRDHPNVQDESEVIQLAIAWLDKHYVSE